jgi:hypothetical protein
LLAEANRASTIASGFQNNAQLFDETSWATEKNLHTDIIRSEYRNRYNQPKPFHKASLVPSNGRLRKREPVYDLMDKAPTRFWKSKMNDTTKYAPRQMHHLRATSIA